MTDAAPRIDALTPERRELLLRWLIRGEDAAASGEPQWPELVPDPAARHEPFELTEVQRAYWTGLSGYFGLGAGVANVFMEFDVQGIDETIIQAFNQALDSMIERHDVLRSVVLPDGRQQVTEEVLSYQAEVLDHRDLMSEAQEEQLAEIRRELKDEKGNMGVWPRFRFLFHRLGDRHFRLQARIDACLIDGRSRGDFIQELTQLMANPAAVQAPPEVSYRDYAVTWAGFKNSEAYQRSRQYWFERLPSLPPAPKLPLVTDLTPATPSRFGDRLFQLLAPDAWTRLKARAAQHGVTPSGVAAAAFVEVLGRWAGSDHFSVGLISTNRPPIHPNISDVLGNFNTIQLLEIDLAAASFEQRAKTLQRRITDDLEHRHFSGFEVLEEINRRQGGNTRANMPIMLDSVIEYSHAFYRRQDGDPDQTAGPQELPAPEENDATTDAQDGGDGTSQAAYPYGDVQVRELDAGFYIPQTLVLLVLFQPGDDSLMGKLELVEDLFPPGTVDELIGDVRQLLGELAATEDAWETPRPVLPVDHVAPRDELEGQLAELWREVLNLPHPVGVTESFFELGGSSFLAVRLLARARELGAADPPLGSFFRDPTIEHLAKLLRQDEQTVRAAGPPRAETTARAEAATAEKPATASRPNMKAFFIIWFGQLVSQLGSGLGAFAVGVWIYQRTESATLFTLAAFFAVLPAIFVSPLAGAVADRYDRRRVMMMSDLGAGVCSMTIMFLLWTGQLQVWHLYFLIFGITTCSSFQQPAFAASIPLLVPRKRLGQVSGMTTLGPSLARILSPFLAGFLTVTIGIEKVMLIDVATFLFAVTTFAFVRIPIPPATAAGMVGRGSLLRESFAGWRFILERRGLLALLVLFAVMNFSLGMMQVLITPLILSIGTAATLGMVQGVASAGTLAGGLVMTAWGGPKRRVAGILICVIAQGAMLFLGGLRADAVYIATVAFVFLFFTPIINGTSQVIWQVKVPLDLQGRVFAMRSMIALSSAPVAFLLAGPMTDYVFEPLLAPDGPLAGSVGLVIGVGPGRGIGLLYAILGLILVMTACAGFFLPRLRQIEGELPDALSSSS